MSETPRIYDITGQKELEGDVDIEKKDFSTSLKILTSAETLVEFSPLERWNDIIAANGDSCGQTTATTGTSLVAYRLYKRRWVGLIQLALLNMLFGWNWQIPFSVSPMAASYFQVSEMAIYALSLSYIGSLAIFSPLVLWVIYLHGTRLAFVIAGLALASGSLIQYVATMCVKFEMFVLANLIFGAGASCAMIMPTHYSDLWFSPGGRMGATAAASLAFSAGSGIGQLVGPFLGPTVQAFSSMILIALVVSAIVSLGVFCVTAKPPTLASASRSISKAPLLPAFALLLRSKNFWLLSIPFAVYSGLATATLCLLDQIFPYDGYAWVCGAIFIGSGLVTGIILPTITARYNMSLIVIKSLCPIIGLCYLSFIWIPGIRIPLASYFVAALLGGASFSLVPITLEYLVDITHPVAPESTSSLCLVAGFLLSSWFTVIMEVLAFRSASDSSYSMRNSLIFQAVFSLAVVPLPFCLGPRSTKVHIERR